MTTEGLDYASLCENNINNNGWIVESTKYLASSLHCFFSNGHIGTTTMYNFHISRNQNSGLLIVS